MTQAQYSAARSIRRAPPREPLFDDELPARHLTLVGRDEVTLPFGEAFEPAPRAAVVATVGRPDDLPEPVRFGRFFIQGVLEVLCGRRPAAQLARHTSPRVHAGLTRDQAGGNRFEASGRNPVIHSVRVMEPADQVAELTAVVQVGARFRAIAARFEGRDGRWCCVRLQIG
ncbi:MAG: uncharacterized protein JWM76_2096 [Pseudonocardiales bacterium]|nr:uncharacterized protein [Pseudonocardiales bacterium]